jgi:hypothetical protein
MLAVLCGLVPPGAGRGAGRHMASLPRGFVTPRARPCRASLVPVAPLTTLPPGAADAALEQMLLRVLTAEETFAAAPAQPKQPRTASASAVDSVFGAGPQGDDDLVRLSRAMASAGFVLVGQREAALAAALQPTAVERLTVRPQLEQCDPALAQQMGLAGKASPTGASPIRDGAGWEANSGRWGLDRLRRSFSWLPLNLISSPPEDLALSRSTDMGSAAEVNQSAVTRLRQPRNKRASVIAEVNQSAVTTPRRPETKNASVTRHACPADPTDPKMPAAAARRDTIGVETAAESPSPEQLLYGGRVIIWRRDYGTEVRQNLTRNKQIKKELSGHASERCARPKTKKLRAADHPRAADSPRQTPAAAS